MRIRLFAFAVLAVFAFAARTQASTVVFDSGAPQLAVGTSSYCYDPFDPVEPCSFADDFVLDGLTWVTDAHLYVRVAVNSTWDQELPWAIYADDGGLPGSVLASGTATVPPGSVVDLGNLFFEYSFDLDTPLLLDGGTTYWFGIAFPLGPPGADAYFWNTTLNAFGSFAAIGLPGSGSWSLDDERRFAFALTGTPVPEPATLLLLGTGLAVAARKRFAKRS